MLNEISNNEITDPNNKFNFLSYTQNRIAIQDLKGKRYFKFLSSIYKKNLLRIYKNLVPCDSRILEIGCGDGEFLSKLRGSISVGIDFVPQKIKVAKDLYPHCQFFLMDAHSFSLVNQKFDIIILSDLLNDVWDVQNVLEQIKPYCTNDTRIIINVYSHLWNIPLSIARMFRIAKPQLNQNWLTRNDIINFLQICDYELINYKQEILFPFPIFNYFFNRFLVKIFPFNHFSLSNFFVARTFSSKPISNLSVSIIIPTRNEEGNISEILKRIPDLSSDTEIIFVEGNSTDSTYNTIESEIKKFPHKNCKLLKQSGNGKGDAVRLGFNKAKNEVLMILDADMTVPPEDLSKFYELILSNKAEFINGVRLIYPMENEAMRFFNLLGNKFFSASFSWLLGQPIRDTLCGTKVLRKSNYLRIISNRSYFGDFDPFGDFDLLFGAAKLNLKILEVPIRYRSRKYGETNISRWTHGWLLLKMVFFAAGKIKFN
jgi:SAM-dependent methyltransferase